MLLFPVGVRVALFRFSPYWVLVLGRGLGFGRSGISVPSPLLWVLPLLIVLGLVVGRGRIRGAGTHWFWGVIECSGVKASCSLWFGFCSRVVVIS